MTLSRTAGWETKVKPALALYSFFPYQFDNQNTAGMTATSAVQDTISCLQNQEVFLLFNRRMVR